MAGNPLPVLTGDPKVDRALVALARLAADIARGDGERERRVRDDARDPA